MIAGDLYHPSQNLPEMQFKYSFGQGKKVLLVSDVWAVRIWAPSLLDFFVQKEIIWWNPGSAKTSESLQLISVIRVSPCSCKVTATFKQNCIAWAAKADLSVAFCRDEQGLDWFFSVDNLSPVPCHRPQRDLLQYLDSPKFWAGKASSGVSHFIPVYFHGASAEISEVSDNPF